MYYLYILRSISKSFIYVGTTRDLNRRLRDHNLGRNKSTQAYRPFVLAHIESFEILSDARKREWSLKCTPTGGKEKKRLAAGG